MAKRKVAETYQDFQAAITDEEEDKIEAAAKGFGVNRRIALASLRRSREQLMTGDGKMANDKIGEALMLILDQLDDYDKHLDAMKDMVKSASARVIATAQTMIDRGMTG